ncbi:DUF2336 domain-containing protein [Bradyrhizobium lablabi]|uniref:DUF2336 domain-containing protein n=1 Tax=Bradyrhizobium lablabi TaxID=722472 RepID=UPI001BACA54B|nr:DUF2336 domain-containing protein [Bradyrhizobium lablabi]MBR1125498.1 DUF2336 domain-containing protein [Bradyrhizobium lablabi]
MPNHGQAIADEIEAAIRGGSTQKRLDTARRVTNLFLASAGSFNNEQVELFDNVLERLVKAIELRSIADISARMALTEISTQLAPIAQAPPSVIGHFARHDEISIAAPVLRESARLSEEDLIEIAATKSEQHLLAVSGRWWLKEIVTDALLGRQYPSVSRRIVANPGARVSASGFAIIVGQAETDTDLAVEAGIRMDLPSALRRQLLSSATEEVRTRLLSRAPPYLFEDIRNAIAAAAAGADREMSRVRDFAAARDFVAKLAEAGELDEATLFEFASQKRYEETVAALAELSESAIEVIRPLMQSLRDDGVLVACKAAGLTWDTTAAVLECRYSTGSPDAAELARAKLHFARTSTENARRMLTFWKVRSTPAASRMN